MELRQINYFITVAEELHFRKAADRIGISQPALSQQIQQLEEEIGGELFIRSKRKVSLTEAGKAFLPEAISLITQSVRAVDITRKAFSGLIGELTIGFVESATWDILPSILKIYRKLYPEVRISLLRLSTAQQVKQLAENKIHGGIVGYPVKEPLSCYSLREESYWVALPAGHSLTAVDMIRIEDLKKEEFITTSRETGQFYYDSMVKVCMDGGFSPMIVQTANEIYTVLSLVSCGIGIALIHESAKNLRNDVIYKPLYGTKQWAYQFSFAWKEENAAPAVKCLLEVIKEMYPRQIEK